jgi:hypothetical protein
VCPHFLMELHASLDRGGAERRLGRVHSAVERHHDVAARDRRRIRGCADDARLGIDWDFAAIERRAPRARTNRSSEPFSEVTPCSRALAHDPLEPQRRRRHRAHTARRRDAARRRERHGLRARTPGHKVATRVIRAGSPIRRYNQIIGFASRDIAPASTCICTISRWARSSATTRSAST